jgi:hypothetical protein
MANLSSAAEHCCSSELSPENLAAKIIIDTYSFEMN